MSCYKFKREIFRLYMNILLCCPVGKQCKTTVIKHWKKIFCMTEAFDPSHPFHEIPKSVVSKVLDLSCTSGFGQTVHPDVLYVGGWGSGGWKYVMTVTGFPYANDYYENPEFLVSNDGLEWSVPYGGKSPLVKYPDYAGYCYNSDPALFYDDGQIHLFYREVLTAKTIVAVSIYHMCSKDGLTWEKPHKILSCESKNGPAVLLSPSIMKIGASYFMWYVEKYGTKCTVCRIESKDLSSWSSPVCTIIHDVKNPYPWHIDVVMDNDRLIMAFCSDSLPDGRRSIFFAESRDYGSTWNVIGKVFMPEQYGFGGAELYKPSLCRDENDGWRLYYSANTKDGAWFTAMTFVTL